MIIFKFNTIDCSFNLLFKINFEGFEMAFRYNKYIEDVEAIVSMPNNRSKITKYTLYIKYFLHYYRDTFNSSVGLYNKEFEVYL